MYNKKLKKLLATLLATAMVFGCCATAFAGGTDPSGTDPSQQQSDPQNNNDSGSGSSTTPATPGGSGGATGVGESEGHVDKFKVTMVLPTVDANTFKYIVDPEKLIEETSGAKYTGMTFPAAATDTHVYFKTSATTYANTTNTFYAVNKGTKPVTLTVKVKAVSSADATKDLGLATGNTSTDLVDSDGKSLLYLALNVGSDSANKTVLTLQEQTVTKTIAGSANYETTYNSQTSKYEYTEKDKAENTLGNSWNAIAINLTGAVGDKSIAADATSPSVSVTWSWAEAAADATVTEGAATTVTEYTDDTGATSYLTAAEATAKLAELSSSSSGSGTDNSGSGTDNSGSGTDTSGSGTTPAPVVTPSVNPTSITSSAPSFTISNGTLDRIVMTRTNGEVVNWVLNTQYTVSGNTVTVKAGPFNTANAGATLTIYFQNETATATVQMP